MVAGPEGKGNVMCRAGGRRCPSSGSRMSGGLDPGANVTGWVPVGRAVDAEEAADEERYRRRAAQLDASPDPAGLIRAEQVNRDAADVDDTAQRLAAQAAQAAEDERHWR